MGKEGKKNIIFASILILIIVIVLLFFMLKPKTNEDKLKNIFYNSECYKANKDRFGFMKPTFNIMAYNGVSIYNQSTGMIIAELSGGGSLGEFQKIYGEITEAQSIAVWRVEGNVYRKPLPKGGVTANGNAGCLLIVDENITKILVQGWHASFF